MGIADDLIRDFIAPVLVGAGFVRYGRKFQIDTPASVGALAVDVGKSRLRFTLVGGVGYKAWNRFLGASASLRDPIAHGDWRTVATDPGSPFGPDVEKWWDVPVEGQVPVVGAEVRTALEKRMIPELLKALEPHEDLAALSAMFNRGRCPAELLPRLLFWLVHLEPAEQAGEVRDRLISLGRLDVVQRIDAWNDAGAD